MFCYNSQKISAWEHILKGEKCLFSAELEKEWRALIEFVLILWSPRGASINDLQFKGR